MNPEKNFKKELRAYRILLTRWRDDPVLYARQRLGLRPTPHQQALLRALVPEGAKVSARAGHGVGKSAATAGAVWWFLETRHSAKVPCTAPTSHQLRDVLWAEIAKWMRYADAVSKQRGDHPAFWLGSLFRITADRVFDRGSGREWFAVARTSGRDNPDALQGFHASNLTLSADGTTVEDFGGGGNILFLVDEASGVHEDVFTVAEGALSSHGARLLMIGNPTKNTGYFAESHKSRRSMFNCLHFRSQDSPLVSDNYRSDLVRKYGEGSNIVRVRADGAFPKQDDDVLIPLELAERALSAPRVVPPPNTPRKLGIDVARYGDDRTVFVLRHGVNITNIEIRAKEDTMQTAGRAVQLIQEWRAEQIFVDSVGVGGGVVDRLREMGKPVVGVNVANTAPVRGFGGNDAQGKTLRDHLWLEMAAWLRDDSPSFLEAPPDHAQDLAGELASVKFKIASSGHLVIESKDDMKKRGLRSSDLADALGVTFAPGGGGPSVASARRRPSRNKFRGFPV
jgi:hypothetical protein